MKSLPPLFSIAAEMVDYLARSTPAHAAELAAMAVRLRAMAGGITVSAGPTDPPPVPPHG